MITTRIVLLLTSLTVANILYAQDSPDSLYSRQLDELVVTGSNNPVGRNLLPYTVTTIGSSQLEATGSSQLLSAVSGMVPSLLFPNGIYLASVSAMAVPAISKYVA